MTVRHLSVEENQAAHYTGIASDTKPTPNPIYKLDSFFWEIDTGNVYKWRVNSWYLVEVNGAPRGGDFSMDVTRGLHPRISSVNKFGRTTNADSGTAADVHDGANATDDVATWVAPTQARTHDIASTDANDDGSPAGTGAQTIRIYGLKTWASGETSEDITMDGTTNVATAFSYVIIHRVKALTWGSAGPNVGVITATAQTDGTVTAQINAGEGQTQMAIYGIGSQIVMHMTQYYSSVNRAVSANVDIRLLVNQYCDNELTGFVAKHTNGIKSDGTGSIIHRFDPRYKIEGPAIIKIEVTSGTNNTTVDAGFDGYLEDISDQS